MTIQPDGGAGLATDAATPSGRPAGPAAVAPEKLNLTYHVVIGVAIGVVSLFTVFAWPFALLTGMVIGKSNSDRRTGRAQRSSVVQLLAVTGGVLAMLFFGALIGGLIAFLVVALAAFSERVAEDTRPIDQTMARIVISTIAVVVWFVVFVVVGLKVNLSFG
jgi:hypothetical protein